MAKSVQAKSHLSLRQNCNSGGINGLEVGIVLLKVGNEVPSVILYESQHCFSVLGGRKNQKLIQSTQLFVEVMVCTQLIDSWIPCQNITSSTSVSVL